MRHRVVFGHSLSLVLPAVLAAVFVSSVGYCEESAATFSPSIIHDSRITPAVCRHCGSQHCQCELSCCPRKVAETEEKSFWKVTCEYVCIPGFRFPWECKQDPCGCECLVCGTVRAVNILQKEKYECETCGYEWEIMCVRRSSEAENSGDCQCPRCADKMRARIAGQDQPVTR